MKNNVVENRKFSLTNSSKVVVLHFQGFLLLLPTSIAFSIANNQSPPPQLTCCPTKVIRLPIKIKAEAMTTSIISSNRYFSYNMEIIGFAGSVNGRVAYTFSRFHTNKIICDYDAS